MGTYQGPATVTVDGVEHEAEADLRSDSGRQQVRSFGASSSVQGLVSWGGTLDLDDDGAAWAILNGGVLTLTLPTGAQGQFLARHYSVGGPIVIRGNGAPPF